MPPECKLNRHARAAVAALSSSADDTRRLGVIPTSYGCVLANLIEGLTGSRPTLKTADVMLCLLRTTLWDAACSSFRAARSGRTWVYANDPEDLLFQTEDARMAQTIFERDRNARRTKPAEDAPQAMRRSARGRVAIKFSPDFHWNHGDEYVMALDEHQSGTRAKRHAGIRRRTRKRLTALI